MDGFYFKILNKLKKKGRIDETDIPEEYREENLKTSPEPEDVVQNEVETPAVVKLGPISIPKVIDRAVTVASLKGQTRFDTFLTSDIFTSSLLGDKPMPIDTKYSAVRVEQNTYVFKGKPAISIIDMDNGFNLVCNGEVKINVLPRTNLFRVDIKIESSNYDDMVFSVYYISE